MGDALCISMTKYRLPSISCESWEQANELAKNEANQVKMPYYAVEYRENPSPDGMLFFEAASPTFAEQIRKYYEIVRIQIYK